VINGITHQGSGKVATRAIYIRICDPVASLVLSSISTTGDLEELPVIEADGKYRTCIVSVLDAPPHFV